MESVVGRRDLVTVRAVLLLLLLVVVGDFGFGMFGRRRRIPTNSEDSHAMFETALVFSSVSHGLAKRISAALLVLVAFFVTLLVPGKLLLYRHRCWYPIPAAVAEKETKALSALKHGDVLEGCVFRSLVVATCCGLL